jgi:hypothetical protein
MFCQAGFDQWLPTILQHLSHLSKPQATVFSNSNFGFAVDSRLLMEADFAEAGAPLSHQETAMTRPLSFDHLQAILRQHTAGLPDVRKPSPNTRYTVQNAA